jgi:hypothetical protein
MMKDESGKMKNKASIREREKASSCLSFFRFPLSAFPVRPGEPL